MDLHVIAPLPSAAERAAVDAIVGAAASGWSGGARNPATDGHVAYGGHAARAQRDLLLPALRAVQDRIGFVSEPALAYICRRLSVPPAIAYGVASFYALLATKARPPAVAHLCDDIACRLRGAEGIVADLVRSLGAEGAPAREGRMTWHRSPCLGLCERAPAAFFTVAGATPIVAAAGPVDAAGIVRRLEHWTETNPGSAAGAHPSTDPAPTLDELRTSVPQHGEPA